MSSNSVAGCRNASRMPSTAAGPCAISAASSGLYGSAAPRMSFGKFSLDMRACVATSRRTAATSPGARREATMVRRRGFDCFALMAPLMAARAGARILTFSASGPGTPLQDVQRALRFVTFRCALRFAAAGSLHRSRSQTWALVNTTRAVTGADPLTANVPAGQGAGLDRAAGTETALRAVRMIAKPAMRSMCMLYAWSAHQSRQRGPRRDRETLYEASGICRDRRNMRSRVTSGTLWTRLVAGARDLPSDRPEMHA